MTEVVKQVDLKRELVAKHGRDPELVCRFYAQAEKDGIVQRKSNKHLISSDDYARRLYRDGARRGWL
jgi:hypothetical protein